MGTKLPARLTMAFYGSLSIIGRIINAVYFNRAIMTIGGDDYWNTRAAIATKPQNLRKEEFN